MSRNILIKNAQELLRVSGTTKKCGKDMGELNLIKDGALVIMDGLITEVGTTEEILSRNKEEDFTVIDAKGKVVMPGFVDSHTHFIFGGYRGEEYNMRLEGVSYSEIMKSGGGIIATVKATRAAKFDELYDAGLKRLDGMLSYGVTTVEGKSGYGLDIDTEIKQLEVMKKLNEHHDMDIVSTYMGAHDIPPEYKNDPEVFIDLIINKGLDRAKGLAKFCDIFTEKGVFEIDESRRILKAAKEKGFKLKIHADEIVRIGGAELAGQMNAVSAEHLLQASDQGIREMIKAGTVCTLLPSTAFSLQADYARARFMIDEGAAVALGSDLNPGSCYTNSIPLMIALSTIYMKMTIEEVITALTLNGAAAIDEADRVGSLDPGKLGDVIILDAPSYKHLSYNIAVNLVEKVIKKGKLVYDKKEAYPKN